MSFYVRCAATILVFGMIWRLCLYLRFFFAGVSVFVGFLNEYSRIYCAFELFQNGRGCLVPSCEFYGVSCFKIDL